MTEQSSESERPEHAAAQDSHIAEKLLVCVGPSPSAVNLVHATQRIAASVHAPWLAVHVETTGEADLSDADRQRIAQTLRLAEQLGGETVTLAGQDVADEIIAYARSRNVTKIIVGKPRQPRWREWLRGSFVYRLTRKCGEIDVYVISGDLEAASSKRDSPAAAPASYAGHVAAVCVVAACTGVGSLMFQHFAPANIIMVYLLGVVAVAMRFGRGPSMIAAILGVAAFDFFFVRPYWTFAVEDTQYVLTFAVMLVTGVVISTLTARVQFQVESARSRERRTAALYAMSRELVHVTSLEGLVESAARHISTVFDAEVYLLLPERPLAGSRSGPLQNCTATVKPLGEREREVADWVFEYGERAGFGTDTLPSSKVLFVPMPVQEHRVGVLGVRTRTRAVLAPDQVRLLETFAGQVALAVVRIQSSDEAQQARLQVESERLRSSLLSAVSHDLRTPLAAIAGASSTLVESNGSLDAGTRRELAVSIYDEAERLNRLVANLLDMTRLEAHALEVRKDWCSVDELVGAVLHRLARLLGGRPVLTHIQPDLPLVQLDELLMHQVLTNLIENAARYAPPDSPIEITAALTDGQLIMEVADRGPGLPPDSLDRVFDKFYRTATAGTRTGVGLGLTICRGIIELHGGQVRAENRAGGGAVFRFTLPLTGVPPELKLDEQDSMT
jgi:two-component system sensor histidine kinase KdpD